LETTICASRWASALPVGERKRRLVAVLWAALGQAAACQCLPMYRRRDQSTMARREFIRHVTVMFCDLVVICRRGQSWRGCRCGRWRFRICVSAQGRNSVEQHTTVPDNNDAKVPFKSSAVRLGRTFSFISFSRITFRDQGCAANRRGP
jgi:hypothetical protein